MSLIRKLQALIIPFILIIYPAYPADMDGAFSAILKQNDLFLDTSIRTFLLDERGRHGSDTYDKYDSSPYLLSFDNKIKYSPVKGLEIGAKLNEYSPVNYNRYSYSPADALTSFQKYNIEYFREYGLSLRARVSSLEFYGNIDNNSQKTKWNYAPYPDPINYFSTINSSFRSYSAGVRFLSSYKSGPDTSDLSLLTTALLSSSQYIVDLGFDIKDAYMKRETYYNYTTGTYYYTYLHDLEAHVSPKCGVRMGILDNLELSGNFSYTSPFKYIYENELHYPTPNSRYIYGYYKWKDNYFFSGGLRYRPVKYFEAEILSDFHYLFQRLESWQKSASNDYRYLPSKRLNYFNATPSFNIRYLHEAGTSVKTFPVTEVSKNLLSAKQWLFEFSYTRDLTHLNKGPDNGAQNVIDPYNVFLHPLDYFVTSTEYAALGSGNSSTYATNISPQNYNLFKASLAYGISDDFNIGARLSYRTRSELDHFTLNDLSERHYVFRPVFFLDLFSDWHISKNCVISFYAHAAPSYTTIMSRSIDPKEQKSTTTYFDVRVSTKFLF